MRIYLTGFMGCGKSSVARALAGLLDYPVLDVDEEIEASASMTVREIFEKAGEAHFRRLEHRILQGTTRMKRVVVATGGGTVTVDANLELIRRHGVAVWLNTPFDLIVARMGSRARAERPLFRDERQARELYRRRLPAYRTADLQIDAGPEENPVELASRIRLLLAEGSCAT